ncbi:hypothetical protein [Methylocystis sp. JR02]|uniref:hypothetical protein n=1 Tax=Methylocystis sp. JR02 TaxID=3046284 RepID=UPI0024BA424B|nr:hypothetical protein [Methylocystis sp. JR02]MDJ0447719.1 hypothetical protein [Methylocystis sp. JR02]
MASRAGATAVAVAGLCAAADVTGSEVLVASALRAGAVASAAFSGAALDVAAALAEAGAAAGFATGFGFSMDAAVLCALAGVIFSSDFTTAVAAVFAADLTVFAPALPGAAATAPRAATFLANADARASDAAALRAAASAPLLPLVFVVAFAAVVTGASTRVFAAVLALFAADLLVLAPSDVAAPGRAALPLFDADP